MSTVRTKTVTVELVANGFLVREPIAALNGVTRGERLYIAEDTTAVAVILEEEVWPLVESDPESEIPGTIEETRPTMEDLQASGTIVRGADIPATAGEATPPEVTYAPATDDGYEYPKVTRKGSRWTIHCPAHGPQRGEFRDNGESLRCTMRDGKTLCAHPGVPKPIAQRMAAASAEGGES